MKTAMQEMMLNIESIESKTTDQEQIYLLTALKIAALVLLGKEKEQLINAYEYGQINVDEDGCLAEENGAEDYYNQTYNQNK